MPHAPQPTFRLRPGRAAIRRVLLLTVAALAATATHAGGQSLERVAYLPDDRDVGPELQRLAARHAAPLLVIGNDVFVVPAACRRGAAPSASTAASQADAGAPRCEPAADGSGFRVHAGTRVMRFWYYDDAVLRPVQGRFVRFAADGSGPGAAAGGPEPDEPAPGVGRAVDANEVNSIFNQGTRAHREENYAAARTAFARAAELDPHFRDAAFYQLLTLEKLEAWEAMIPVGERTLELDPLNQSAMLLLARAYSRTLSAGAPAAAVAPRRARLAELRRLMNDEPVYFSAGARLSAACELQGTLLGGRAAAGSTLALSVMLRQPGGRELVRRVEVRAPKRGAARQVSLPLGDCGHYGARMRYQLER